MSALLRVQMRTRAHCQPIMRAAARAMHTAETNAVHTNAPDAAVAAEAAATPATPATPAAPAAAGTPSAAPAAAARPRSRTTTPPLLQLDPAQRPPFLFFAAPLEDVSDSAWRRLVHAHGRGADVTFSEMARVENMARKAKALQGSSWRKTAHDIEAAVADEAEHALASQTLNEAATRRANTFTGPLTPTVVQLLVNREESLRTFLQVFQPVPGAFAGFNLNLGCPSPDVMSLGLGAQAVKRIAKTQRYVEMLNEFIATRCIGPEWNLRQGLPMTTRESGLLVSAMGDEGMAPVMRPGVSLKMRLGANEREKVQGTHLNLIRALRGDTANGSRAGADLAAGASASSGPVSYFILHARHGGQHYESPADLGSIARAILHSGADNVLANGDIHTLGQVRRCVEMGAAGVMVGRAAVKDPLIMERLKRELREVMPELPMLQGLPASMHSSQIGAAAIPKASASSASSAGPSSDAVQSPSPQALTRLYLSYADRFESPDKYRQNVVSRIGQKFIANPRAEDTAAGKKKKAEGTGAGGVEKRQKRAAAASASVSSSPRGDSSSSSSSRSPASRPSAGFASLDSAAASARPRASRPWTRPQTYATPAAASPATPTHRDTRPGKFVPDWATGRLATPNGAQYGGKYGDRVARNSAASRPRAPPRRPRSPRDEPAPPRDRSKPRSQARGAFGDREEVRSSRQTERE